MKEKTPLHKYELVEKLPNGTLKFRIVKARPWIGRSSETPKVHECPHCGRSIYYRFANDGKVSIEAYLDDEPREG